jgi:hypothetical protein
MDKTQKLRKSTYHEVERRNELDWMRLILRRQMDHSVTSELLTIYCKVIIRAFTMEELNNTFI